MDPSTPQPRTAIDLKILSPSSEVGTGGLQLRNVPVATTVGALKATITESIPSRPSPERQRLIYLGRALARDEEELQSIFGRDVIQHDSSHTLHLVLRDAHTHSSPNRPASVPPQLNSNPFRTTVHPVPASTGPTPVQRNPFATPQTPSPQEAQPPQQAPPHQHPQPLLPGTNIPITQLLANANIRATSGGVPINLPPEVINHLLNQRLAQDGGFNFLANLQPRAQAPAQNPPQPNPAPSSNPTPEAPSHAQLHQQHMAHHQQAPAAMGMQGHGDGNRGTESLPGEPNLNSTPPSVPRRSSDEATSGPPGQADGSGDSATPAPDADGSAAPTGPHQPQTHTVSRTGVNADGSRWRMNMTTTYNDGQHHHHHHNHNHLPGQIPLLQPLPRMPPQFAPQAMHPAMQLRMGTPPVGGPGLRPGGTPRSVSPARSVSEGPRRSATPAAELQHRLEQTMREVGNVNRLLTVMATGHLANGGPAQPLSDQEREQLRVTAHNMNQHIDGFGADLATLINGHPSVRTDPDYAALNSMYQAVQAQGRAIRNQVGAIVANGQTLPNAGLRGGADSHQGSSSSEDNSPNLFQLNTPSAPPVDITQQVDANPTSTPTAPEIHLLTGPSGAPQALLVGPTGPFVTPALSPEVMYALMAAQLPYEQLVQQFTQGVQQLTNANTPNASQADNAQLLQQLNDFMNARQAGQTRNDDNAVIRRITDILGQEQGRRQARRERRQQRDGNQPVAAQAPGAQAPVAAPGQPQAAAQGQAQALFGAIARPAGQNAPPQQQVVRGANNEVRDILAPIVRNLWLAVRIAGFAYFFLSSGRGYWRLLLLGGIAIVIYALNSGWLGRNVDGMWAGLRRHFEGLVDDARRGNPIVANGAQGQQGDANVDAAQNPNPEDAARRLPFSSRLGIDS